MEQKVSEAGHPAEYLSGLWRHPAITGEQFEELAVFSGLYQAFIGDDVRSGVEGRADGWLKGMSDEPFFASISLMMLEDRRRRFPLLPAQEPLGCRLQKQTQQAATNFARPQMTMAQGSFPGQKQAKEEEETISQAAFFGGDEGAGAKDEEDSDGYAEVDGPAGPFEGIVVVDLGEAMLQGGFEEAPEEGDGFDPHGGFEPLLVTVEGTDFGGVVAKVALEEDFVARFLKQKAMTGTFIGVDELTIQENVGLTFDFDAADVGGPVVFGQAREDLDLVLLAFDAAYLVASTQQALGEGRYG